MNFPFRADIEALRGVAVLAVVIFHLFPNILPGGYAGVDIFFVISGYVVTYALLARQQKDQQQAMGFTIFLQRRLQRIMPPLLVALVLIAAVSYAIYEKRLFYSFSGFSITSLLGISNLKLLAQQTNYFSPDQYLNPYLHTWSLGIEEQFYLIYPLVFLPFVRAERRWRFWLAAVALLLASLLIAWHWSELNAQRAYLSPISRFWELATGVLLALAGVLPRLQQRLEKLKNFAPLAQWLAVAGLVISFCLLSDKAPYPLPGVLLPVFASGVLLCFGVVAPLTALTQCYWLRVLGRISYSLYLYHWPCIVFSRYLFGSQSGYWLPAALVSTVIFSWLSYRFVEQGPWRKASLVQLAVAGGLGLASLIGFESQAERLRSPLGLATFSELAWNANDPQPINQLLGSSAKKNNDAAAFSLTPAQIQQLAPGLTLQLSLVQASKVGALDPQQVLRGGEKRFFVVGDSHAGSLVAAVRSMVAAKPGLVGLLVTPPGMGGCSLLSYSFDLSRCSIYEAQALALVQRFAKPGDNLLLPSLRMPRLSPRLSFAPYINPKTPLMGPSFEPALQQLQRQGVRIALLAPWPVYNVLGKQCLGWQEKLKLECNQSRQDFEKDRNPALQRLRQAQSRLPGLVIIDPINLFCDQQKCSSSRAGRPFYADHDHLSAYGSAALGQWLQHQP